MVDLKYSTTEEELQGIIDVDKWLRSEQAGQDLCGKSGYCVFCNKAEKNPCARAAIRERKIIEKEAAAEITEDKDGYVTVTRYRRSFTSKLIQHESIQDFYTAVKNSLMSYKGVRCRTSFNFESFRAGRKLLAKIAVRGKSVYVFLALNPTDYAATKYRFEDVSEKKSYIDTPMKIKITSRRATKHCTELIAALMENNEIATGKAVEKVYRFAYKTDENLIEKGLIKPYTVKVKVK